MVTLEFFDDPTAFLDAAGGLLAADPVLGSVVATVTARAARERSEGRDSWAHVGAPFDRWWVVVRDESGAVVSAAMRTAPFAPHPLYVLPMPDATARLLAGALHGRGERVGGCNGALPAARVIAEETARLGGGRAETSEHLRLWEATAVDVPAAPPGRLRRATDDDAELLLDWYGRFEAEADEQAGHEPSAERDQHATLDDMHVRIREGVVWLWELPTGEVAHLSGRSLPSYGVCRIGPVFTPKEHRGLGIASYVVGELTRTGLEAGHRMCLFTDQANPVSNRIYERLGYRPVVDTVAMLVTAED